MQPAGRACAETAKQREGKLATTIESQNVGADATYKACYLAHAKACEVVSKVLKKLAEVEIEKAIELHLLETRP